MIHIHARGPQRQAGRAATAGTMRLGSLFLTLPARTFTGRQVISSAGLGEQLRT
jgi:hypothetical protein